jgi:hypothetical protein
MAPSRALLCRPCTWQVPACQLSVSTWSIYDVWLQTCHHKISYWQVLSTGVGCQAQQGSWAKPWAKTYAGSASDLLQAPTWGGVHRHVTSQVLCMLLRCCASLWCKFCELSSIDACRRCALPGRNIACFSCFWLRVTGQLVGNQAPDPARLVFLPVEAS